jgi:hypothetical protein
MDPPPRTEVSGKEASFTSWYEAFRCGGTPATGEVEEARSWPVTVDVATAGRAWGIGRDRAYALARQGRFPVPVLRLGRYLRVTRASVLEALGIDDPHHNARMTGY